MNLEELFEKLSYGVLSNLSISGEGSGVIPEKGQRKLTLYTNEALKRIYSRFVLKEQEVTIETYEYITNYHLVPRFAVNYVPSSEEDNEPIRYIMDLPEERFHGDVIRILSVRNNLEEQLPLNNEDHPLSVFIPQANVLQVPNPVSERMLAVTYQALHPTLTGDLDQRIELHPSFEEALIAYIAYKTYSHMNTQDATAKSQEHYQLFEGICKEVEDRNTASTSTTTSNTRFERNGWI